MHILCLDFLYGKGNGITLKHKSFDIGTSTDFVVSHYPVSISTRVADWN